MVNGAGGTSDSVMSGSPNQDHTLALQEKCIASEEHIHIRKKQGMVT